MQAKHRNVPISFIVNIEINMLDKISFVNIAYCKHAIKVFCIIISVKKSLLFCLIASIMAEPTEPSGLQMISHGANLFATNFVKVRYQNLKLMFL
jgi:hypothetical protein